jgi:hypothetical protein
MQIYNATQLRNVTPRIGFLNSADLWPGDAVRNTVPAVALIKAVCAALGDCQLVYVDDSQLLTMAQLAELCYKISYYTDKQPVIYGWTATAMYSRNLFPPENPWGQDTFNSVESWTTVPVYRRKPLSSYVAAVCPSLYLMRGIEGYTSFDAFQSFVLVADMGMHGALRAAERCKKPVIPFVHLEAGAVAPADELAVARRMLDWFSTRRMTAVAIWDNAEAAAPLTRYLGWSPAAAGRRRAKPGRRS